MSISKTPFASLFLLTAVTAQGTLPPGFESTESPSVAGSFGAVAQGRAQIANWDLVGKGARTLKEISFRQDARASSLAVGRSWKSVKVQLGSADLKSFGKTYSANIKAPVTVFDGAHSFPDLTKAPSTTPAAWDNGGLKFPFKAAYPYAGANGIVLDFQFAGGTLANGATWGSAYKPVPLDGVSVRISSGGVGQTSGHLARTHPCVVDSSMKTSFFGPWVLNVVSTYAKNTGSPVTSGNFGLSTGVAFAPPNTTFMVGLSVDGSALPTPTAKYPALFGTKCQHLMIDMSRAIRVTSHTTNAQGQANPLWQFIPYHPAAVGLTLWSQGIWADTVTRQPKLTRVCRSQIAPQPADPANQLRYLYDNTQSTILSTAGVPLFRYR